tara:strand:- start:400 stop:1101 length:702 start_codon:yes stop_codon:yes gene_type:complete
MIILAKLLLAHLVGDFLLQPKSWVEEKEKKKSGSGKLYLHLLIHAALTLLALGFAQWPMVLAVVVSHGLIDAAKLHFQKQHNRTAWFFLDQFLHLMVILLVWLNITANFAAAAELLENADLFIYAAAIFFLTRPSAIIMAVVMKPWSSAIANDDKNSLSNAGKYIGMLERLFVFCFIVTHHWEAVGFLLTAKSVFRFGDLKKSKERKLTEYVLIGTMLSFGLAIVAGLLVVKV